MKKSPALPSTKLNRSPSSWSNLEDRLCRKLQRIENKGRKRGLNLAHLEDTVDLSHNDYLGLRHDTKFQNRVIDSLRGLPVGSGGSRLLGGEHPIFQKLEARFSEFKGVESSLFFPSGYAANEAICRAIIGPNTGVYSDSLNHASLIDGFKISQLSREQKFVFAHNNLQQLETLLKESPYEIKLVFTESLFSMDGDFAPLDSLYNLCEAENALLIIDEAHGLATYGRNGGGLISQFGLDPQKVISINPCGKGMAASGAFICGPEWLRDYLINSCRELIFSTAPSPWIAQALLESITTIETMNNEREYLSKKSQDLRDFLQNLGFDTGASCSHIIPIILGNEEKSLHAESFLKSKGITAKAIRPPSVHPRSCRLRVSLNSGLSEQSFSLIKQAFKELHHVL